MVERIPSTFSMNEIQSLSKLFETWFEEYLVIRKKRRNNKIKKFVQKYLGWITALVALVKPAIELKNTIYP